MMRITLNMNIAFGKIVIFYYVGPPYARTWVIFPFSDTFFNFLILVIQVLYPLRYFMLSVAIVKGDVSFVFQPIYHLFIEGLLIFFT